jgi:hypothetical protein
MNSESPKENYLYDMSQYEDILMSCAEIKSRFNNENFRMKGCPKSAHILIKAQHINMRKE